MPTLDQYQALLEGKTYGDDQNLGALPIEHYDHDHGWSVDGFEKRQWLSIKKYSKFGGYDYLSFDKLGFNRPVPTELCNS